MMFHKQVSLSLVATSLLVIGSATASAASLGEKLREAKWDRAIGTWANDSGNFEISYAWKLEDHLLESTVKMGDRISVSLIGVEPGTEKLFHIGGDNQGGCIRGEWEMEDNDPVLEAEFTSTDGESREFKVRYHLEDDDTLSLQMGADQQFEMTLSRVKEEAKE